MSEMDPGLSRRKFMTVSSAGIAAPVLMNMASAIPHYALLGKLMTDGAFGGVLVNPDMQAYKTDRSLVEGLYVTGDFASGRFINMGGVKRQVINDISWAFSSGFLAGTNAGRYVERLF